MKKAIHTTRIGFRTDAYTRDETEFDTRDTVELLELFHDFLVESHIDLYSVDYVEYDYDFVDEDDDTEGMKEYGIRVHRIYDIYVEAESLEEAEELAAEKAASGYDCADDEYCETLKD